VRPDADAARTPTGRAWWSAILPLLACAAFVPILHNGWTTWDDPANFVDNPDFRGLGWSAIGWAWTTFNLGVYQPLTWMLLEAERSLWGLNPRGYHLASLLLHAFNALALYVLAVALVERASPPASLRQTRAIRLGAGLAVALFAAHPLRVEVVAWVSCQPYLPCAFCMILAVLAYLRAAEGREPWLWATGALFVAALLFHAIALGLPAVLVILDIYPLRRLGGPSGWRAPAVRRVWREKRILLVPVLLASVIAVWARDPGRAGEHVASIGLMERFAQASYGAAFYPAKTLVPTDLTAFYPRPVAVTFTRPIFLAAALMVAGVTALAILTRKRWPGLLAAWACYLAILTPNLGLVQIGSYFVADRYSYLATMGGTVLLAGVLARAIASGRRLVARGAIAASLAALAACSALTWSQCRIWHDGESLWAHADAHGGHHSAIVRHGRAGALFDRGMTREAQALFEEALRLDPLLVEAHHNLARLLAKEGKVDDAIAHEAEAVRLRPSDFAARFNLGTLLVRRGRVREALPQFAEAVRLKPGSADVHYQFALALADQKKDREARRHFAEASRLAPHSADASNALGQSDFARGDFEGARTHYAEAARIDPASAEVCHNLGSALVRLGRLDEATREYAEAVRLAPDFILARKNLAKALTLRGKLGEALPHYKELVRLEPQSADALTNLGLAQARLDRLDEAAATLSQALAVAPDNPTAREALDEVRHQQAGGEGAP